MLKHLYISSFVIIDEIHIDFDEGMSVMTGETGAGKSIIIDALSQLCGQRSSTSFIKKGKSKCIIEGIFDVHINDAIKKICEEIHIEPDEQFVISKEILSTGKSQVKINYQNASNNALKILMPYLIDIHSQFETQKLFEEKNHIILLDQYIGNQLDGLKNEYYYYYQRLIDDNNLLKKIKEEDMSDEQKEYLQSQVDEIDDVPYTDEQIEEMEQEMKMLQNYEKVSEHIHNFDYIMHSSQGILSLLNDALNELSHIHEYNDFQESYDDIFNIYYHLNDEYEKVMDIYREFQFDEYRFQELQDIIFKVNRIKRKYGFTMKRVQEYRTELIEQIQKIENREEYIDEITKSLDYNQNKAYQIACQIHNIRKEYALQFEKDIHQQLNDLYLDKAIFKVHFSKTDLSNNGIDKISFMISVNKGQNLSLLNESASGGEISRIMLAIKTITLQYNDIETIIFDEVDTGVSGKVASRIGEKMKSLSSSKQVICITHLPQVACAADNHYCIEKTSTLDETVSSIRLLNTEERIEEIAKMLSGEILTKEAIENAKILLNV